MRSLRHLNSLSANGGIRLIKYWLEVSNDEQKRRFEARINDPLRQWISRTEYDTSIQTRIVNFESSYARWTSKNGIAID